MDWSLDFAQTVFDTYDVDTLSAMPTDGYIRVCECEFCKGKATPRYGDQTRWGWTGELSAYVWGYVNEFAKELSKPPYV